MATNSRQSLDRDPQSGIGTAAYPMVDRRLASTTGLESEPFETLRDLLGLESRLQLTPPGRWSPETQATTERSWSGYEHTVRLSTPSVLGTWSVTVDGTTVAEDVGRRKAFQTAAGRMREIMERATASE